MYFSRASLLSRVWSSDSTTFFRLLEVRVADVTVYAVQHRAKVRALARRATVIAWRDLAGWVMSSPCMDGI